MPENLTLKQKTWLSNRILLGIGTCKISGSLFSFLLVSISTAGMRSKKVIANTGTDSTPSGELSRLFAAVQKLGEKILLLRVEFPLLVLQCAAKIILLDSRWDRLKYCTSVVLAVEHYDGSSRNLATFFLHNTVDVGSADDRSCSFSFSLFLLHSAELTLKEPKAVGGQRTRTCEWDVFG